MFDEIEIAGQVNGVWLWLCGNGDVELWFVIDYYCQ